ncbi:ribonuclease, Rne/Rng family protein [Synechococcus sp. PCC 7335]|nr:Rne/Rng family ribonuclease [Synechococcus sp. PCC 7335]EDX86581.1 ribonuclease, Rne/Rng family protein [Synechococcus sp. PCC 7335]
MSKQIVIAEQHRIAAVFSEDQIQEIIVATGSHQVGDIYLGTVENILPSIDAAFINIGDSDKNGFMHVSDLGPLKLKRMAGSITELLAPQQKVLVQIMKEPTGNKGPRLTGKVTLPGRYLVLMPYGKGVNLSRRIRNEAERNRLRALGILVKPAGMGLLIRTEAEGVPEDAIIEDLESLQRSWEDIQQEAMATRPPSLLNRDDDFIQKVLRDGYNDDVNRIVTDTESGLQRTKKHLTSWNNGRIPSNVLVDYHNEPTHVLEYFRVNAAIREALKPRVDLPSGGYIIIEPTEALTVIDVNSGSFTRSATSRETVLWTNCEAAVEIARQLRLRNIAGVIVVDFIDMDSLKDKMQVLEQFGKAIRADKSRPQISQLTELGLVELTRKRQGQNIYELFGQPCSTCGGLGHLAHLPGEDPEKSSQLESVSSPRSAGYSSPSQSFSNRPTARELRSSSSSSPQSEFQELELLNHPSYNDKNGRGGRRRRRRGAEGASSNRLSRSGSPLPVTVDKGADRNGDERRRRRGSSRGSERVELERTGREAQQDRSQEAQLSDQREEQNGKPANAEVGSRNKRVRNDRRKSEDLPEIVAVEMPLEEQRVYAVMGLSPLVYSQQVIENQQNSVVSVVLPGEAEDFLAKAKAAAETARSNKRVIETPNHISASNSAQDEIVQPDEQATIGDELDDSATSGGGQSFDDDANDNPSDKSTSVRKRRRSAKPVIKEETTKELPVLKSSDHLADEESLEVDYSDQLAADGDSTDGGRTEEEALGEDEPVKVVRRRRRRRSSASE